MSRSQLFPTLCVHIPSFCRSITPMNHARRCLVADPRAKTAGVSCIFSQLKPRLIIDANHREKARPLLSSHKGFSRVRWASV